jgi:putative hydrolase of the HAD superfamily
VEALLFDLGRVVIDLSVARVHAHWASLAGLPAAELEKRTRQRIAGSEAFHRHERGQISDADFYAYLRTALEIELPDAEMEAGWNAIFVGEMPGIRPLLSRAGRSLPLYAFTNTNAAHQVVWSVRFADLLAPFRRIYTSHELGVRKPDAAAFLAVAAGMGVPPQRILFFDDVAENVAGARAVGMQAVQVTAVADIERALSDFAVAAG